MQKYSLSEFVKETEQQTQDAGLFELEGNRFLEVNLDGSVLPSSCNTLTD